MTAHTCNPNTQEAEAQRSQVQYQLELHYEVEASLGFIVRPLFQEKKKKKFRKVFILSQCRLWTISVCLEHILETSIEISCFSD
jgi:hypothetical protein